MPVGTAKCHAHRGRNRLRERLEARDVPSEITGRPVIRQKVGP